MDANYFLESEGRVGYRHGDDGAELERTDYLEFIARVTSHIPDKGQVMLRYYRLYTNAHRGKVRKAGRMGFPVRIVEEEAGRRVKGRGGLKLEAKRFGSGSEKQFPTCFPFPGSPGPDSP